jgi:hypothetical protein
MANNPVWTKQGVMITPNTHDLNGGIALSGTEESNVLYEANPQILSANPDGKVFKMWFSGGVDICYAESNDGLTWTRYTGTTNGVVLANYAHSRLFKNGSTYYLYANPGLSFTQIDCYTSLNGLSWALAKASALTAGATYDAAIGQLQPVYNNGTHWIATYSCATTSSSSPYGFALAYSTDLLNWTKQGSPVTLAFAEPVVQNIGGTYYCWGHGTSQGSGATPTDGYRAQFTDGTLTAITGLSETFPRTSVSEGFLSNDGQVADFSMVEVNGQTFLYYTATASGNSGTGYTLQCATANATLAQLVTGNEGVILPNLLFIQGPAASTQSGTTVSISYTENTTGNSLLLAAVLVYNSSGSASFVSLKDDLGNNFTKIGSFQGTPVPNGAWGLFYLQNVPAGGARTITLICSGTSAVELSILEYIGQAASPIDTSALTGPNASSASLVTPNIVTNFPDETILALGRAYGQTASAVSGSFNLRVALTEQSADANVASAGSVTGPTFTLPSPVTYFAGTVGVKSGLSDPQTYEITGNAGIAGATISWSGGSTTADSLGNFNTGPLANGSYIITPSKTGYTFSPTSASVIISGASITGVNFGAAQTSLGTSTLLATSTFNSEQLNLGQIRSQTETYLMNTSTDVNSLSWSVAEINGYINEGVLYTQQATEWFQQFANIVCTSSVSTYTGPDTVYQYQRMTWDREFIPQTNEYELDRDDPSWRLAQPNISPYRFYFPQMGQQFQVCPYPTPSQNGFQYAPFSQEYGCVCNFLNSDGLTADTSYAFSQEYGIVIGVADTNGALILFQPDIVANPFVPTNGTYASSPDIGELQIYSTDELNLGALFTRIPDTLVLDTDVPQLPVQCHFALAMYAAMKCFVREGEFQDLQLAAAWFQAYGDWMESVLENKSRWWSTRVRSLEPFEEGSLFAKRLNAIGYPMQLDLQPSYGP